MIKLSSKNKYMKTFIITGDIGFIGIHVSIILLSKGYKLIVIDTLKNLQENL